MNGQMNMIDFMADKTGFNCGEVYRSEGYTNVYDAMPDHECKVEVIDHEGNRFQVECHKGLGNYMVFEVGHKDKGYDICWWRETSGEQHNE